MIPRPLVRADDHGTAKGADGGSRRLPAILGDSWTWLRSLLSRAFSPPTPPSARLAFWTVHKERYQ